MAATLALATVGFDRVRVRLIAGPAAEHVEHLIEATGASGSYEFRFRNVASTLDTRTSAITPYAVLRGLVDLDAHTVIGLWTATGAGDSLRRAGDSLRRGRTGACRQARY